MPLVGPLVCASHRWRHCRRRLLRNRCRRWHAGELACLVDAGRDRLHDRRIRRLRRTQALPVVHRTLVVLAVEGGCSGHRQRLPVRRVDLERAVDQLHRLAAQIAVLAHRQRVGVVGEEVGFVRHQCGQPFIGCCSFGEAPHRVVAARQNDPPFDIVRFLLEPRGQLLDHLIHLLGLELVRRIDGRRDRRKRLRRTELPVENPGEQWHGDCNDDGGRATGLCRRHRHFALGTTFLEQATLELALGFSVLRLGERAAAQIGVEVGKLVAIDRGVCHVALDGGLALCAQQRPEQPPQGDDHQYGGEGDEGGHDAFLLWTDSSRRWASACSASVSGRSSTRARRVFSVRNSANTATSRNARGPNHSSHVVALTGGR